MKEKKSFVSNGNHGLPGGSLDQKKEDSQKTKRETNFTGDIGIGLNYSPDTDRQEGVNWGGTWYQT